MNIFNSLGSNYNFSFVLKALFANNKESHRVKIINFLEKKYNGSATLVYKGREAITLALEILKTSQANTQKSSSELSSRGAEGDVAIPSKKRLLRQVPSGAWLRSARNDKSSYVAINGFTCFAVYKAVMEAGCETEILDLPNSLDLNFSPDLLEKRIKQNSKIKAVIVQNTLGYPCDIEKIQNLCREKNLILIEDLAHCVGTKYRNGEEAGTVGDFAVLSFSQDKIIDAVSGGALIIKNKKYLNRHSGESRLVGTTPESLRNLNDRGDLDLARITKVNTYQQLLDRFYPLFTFLIRKTYPFGIGKIIHFLLKSLNLLSKPMNEGFYKKYDLPNWYCSLVLDGFYNLKKNLEHRKQIVNIYNSILDKKITSYPSTLRYAIFVENRKDLINYLKKEGVYVSDIWYDSVDEALKNAKESADKILNLPTHINVSEEDARVIALKINKWLKLQ